jgi:hypothetical protein
VPQGAMARRCVTSPLGTLVIQRRVAFLASRRTQVAPTQLSRGIDTVETPPTAGSVPRSYSSASATPDSQRLRTRAPSLCSAARDTDTPSAFEHARRGPRGCKDMKAARGHYYQTMRCASHARERCLWCAAHKSAAAARRVQRVGRGEGETRGNEGSPTGCRL